MVMITAFLTILVSCASGAPTAKGVEPTESPLSVVLRRSIEKHSKVLLVTAFQQWNVGPGDLARSRTLSAAEVSALARELRVPASASFDWERQCQPPTCQTVTLAELRATAHRETAGSFESYEDNLRQRYGTASVIELGHHAEADDCAVVFWSEDLGMLDARLLLSVLRRVDGAWRVTEEIEVLVS